MKIALVLDSRDFGGIESTISEIFVDFDPHQDLGCDQLISITTNGKRIFTHY